MFAAALMMTTVSSGRLILAHQWLLHMATIAKKHYTYGIFFISTWQQLLKWFALR
jgi:hypothetical protein